jgi:hypothetical protein
MGTMDYVNSVLDENWESIDEQTLKALLNYFNFSEEEIEDLYNFLFEGIKIVASYFIGKIKEKEAIGKDEIFSRIMEEFRQISQPNKLVFYFLKKLSNGIFYVLSNLEEIGQEEYKVTFEDLIDAFIKDKEIIKELENHGYEEPEEFIEEMAKYIYSKMEEVEYFDLRSWLATTIYGSASDQNIKEIQKLASLIEEIIKEYVGHIREEKKVTTPVEIVEKEYETEES